MFSIAFAKTHSFATAQIGDILIVENDTFWIFSNPLEPYFEQKGSRTIGDHKMQGFCTALWRGYVATWKLENDSLFLVRIQADYCNEEPTEIDIKPEFNNSRVHANWVNHSIVRPYGEELQYIHAGYMSIYEEDWVYKFENGILTNIHKEVYLEKDDSKIFPSETFLSDTIWSLIVSSINEDEGKKISENQSCMLLILFDKNGSLSDIRLPHKREPSNEFEKLIMTRAEAVLKEFPQLMKVNHERYYPPVLEMHFMGYSIKKRSE